MDRLRFSSIFQLFSAERERISLWTPLPLMVGISTYFYLPQEPVWWWVVAALTLTAALLGGCWRTRLRVLAAALFLIVLGFSAAQWRTQRMQAPLITRTLFHADVQGSIESIDVKEKGARLVLAQPIIENLPPEQTPQRVRLSFRAYDPAWQIGERVRVQGMVFPLPQPAMPGAYDFARHLYFQGIGGTGIGFRAPEVVSSGGRLALGMHIDALRHTIAEDMRSRMPGEVGTVATAMTVGEMGPIPKETQESLRDAGLSHILSISGLHLSLAAGIVFFTVRLALALVPRFAVRLPVKKIAAVGALVSAFIYLLLAGYPIPAQRSFIMVAFVLLAVLVDRQGISLRSLMVAAVFILLLFPEAMLGASFQMSFAATLAIVAVYEKGGRYLYRPHAKWFERVWRYPLGIAVTSLAATFATAPFVLYHFDRFSSFGLLSNMLVIPLAGFVIMPGVVLSLLLMPLGLQGVGYYPLELGTKWMMDVSRWVAGLPYASVLLPAPTTLGMSLAAFGLIWLCISRNRRLSLLGIPLMIGGLATMNAHISPDVFISGDGRQVMVRLENGQYAMLKGGATSFTAQAWLRSEGQEEALNPKQAGLNCTRERCDYQGQGRHIIALKKPQDDAALIAACAERADVLITWWYMDEMSCTGPNLVIDRRALEAHGAHTLRFTSRGMEIKAVWEGLRGQRPWQVAEEKAGAAQKDEEAAP